MSEKLKVKVSPSLLSADFTRLESEIKRAEEAGADMLHVDVMDGHFVNNITLGPFIVKAMRKATKLPLMSHLMIEDPEKYAEDFAKAGSDAIIFHIETTKDAAGLARKIKSFGKKAGVSLNPKTKRESIKDVLPLVEEVLVMTVEPGFAGQKFMEDQLPKIKWIRERYKGDIAVDGGVVLETARLAASVGANVFAAGTYLFGAKDMKGLINSLKEIKINAN